MTHARGRALLAGGLVLVAVAVTRPASAQGEAADREVLVVEASEGSLDDLLGVPALRGLAAFGGAALLVDGGTPLDEALAALEGSRGADGRLEIEDAGSLSAPSDVADRERVEAIADDVETWLEQSTADEVLVMISVDSPTPADAAAGDELGAVVVANGRPGALADAMERGDAAPGSLSSSSTRRDGVVVTSDLPATIGSFLGLGSAEGFGGSVVRSRAGPPPLELYERYREQRDLYLPVGGAAALYVAVGGVLACVAVAAGPRAPARTRRILGWWSFSVPALAAGLLAAGHLPELSAATAVPFVLIVTVFGTLAVSPLERHDLTLVPVALGAVVLIAFALEAITGWGGVITPLVGGSQLDGGRFYGMPNIAIGLVLGAGVWVAHRLPTWRGVALLAGLALVAGMPFAGANLGAGVSLFATAGMWLAVRERARLGVWRGVAAVVVAAVGGAVVILAAHAVWPEPTHVTRFEETAGGIAGVVEEVVHRLGTGVDLIARNPLALIPVLGLVVVLVVVLRPPVEIRRTFERWPAWRDATLVTTLGGIVACLVNDTGAAAAGFAFGLALGGMLGMSLLSEPGKMTRDG